MKSTFNTESSQLSVLENVFSKGLRQGAGAKENSRLCVTLSPPVSVNIPLSALVTGLFSFFENNLVFADGGDSLNSLFYV